MNDDQSARQVLNFIRTKKSAFWEKEREQQMLRLFHRAAQGVPAYKDFLKKNRINPAKIRNFSDFQGVPPVDKKDYLRQYPLGKLVWGGTLKKPMVFTSTSGSTGSPFYFPRNARLDWESSIVHQLFLENGSRGTDEPTLVLVCFGMGVWIGGVITYKAFEIAAKRGNNPISILTPGINKEEIFKALKLLAPCYKQVILTGYPPFIKDILDEAPEHGIDLRKLNLRILFAAEAFSETFRDYVAKHANIKNVYRDTLNVYGTADIGTMAYETPGAILVRRFAMKQRPLFERIFTSIKKTPTLTQYNPLFVNFEAVNGEIFITGDNAMPLVRYAIGDHGGVHSFSEVEQTLREEGLRLRREAAKVEVPLYELPFVYVYERKDLSTTLYGLQIYPEYIRDILLRKPLPSFLTGRFTLITRFDNKQDQLLEIHLELKKNANLPSDKNDLVLEKIVAGLQEKSSEYRELHHHLGSRAWPRIIFWPNGHSDYFRPGTKQQWVKKHAIVQA